MSAALSCMQSLRRMCSESVQKHLLAEAAPTFKKALELAQALVVAERNAKALKGTSTDTAIGKLHLSYGRENTEQLRRVLHVTTAARPITVQEAVASQMLRAIIVAKRAILRSPVGQSRSMPGDPPFAASLLRKRSTSLQPRRKKTALKNFRFIPWRLAKYGILPLTFPSHVCEVEYLVVGML